MKNRSDCKIVQDLLPNYIEKLTNEETNNYIEEHLKECSECKQVLENMKIELKTNKEKRDEREVKYIKKYSNKMKVLKLILLVIVLIYVVLVGRRMIIMTSLSQKAKESQLNNNYYAKIIYYEGEEITITESYNMGENYLTTKTRYGKNNQNVRITAYKKENDEICLMEYNDQKYIMDFDKMAGKAVGLETYVSNDFFSNLQYAFLIGIDSTYCNGRECYVIKGNSYERYIDKQTGLAIRDISKSTKNIVRENDGIIDYEYTFNNVNDSDIAKPDTTGSVVQE